MAQRAGEPTPAMIEALEFYAERANYFMHDDPGDDKRAAVAKDKGERARAARQPDRRRCDRCGHAAEQHSTDVPELRVFLCQVEGCPCAGWLYRQPEGER